MSAKRERLSTHDDLTGEQPTTPKKRRGVRDHALQSSPNGHGLEDSATASDTTPARLKRGRPAASASKVIDTRRDHDSQQDAPSKAKGKTLLATPSKTRPTASHDSSGALVRNADQSARRKSARNLVGQMAINGSSDDGDFGDENLLAKRIWNGDGVESDDAGEEASEEERNAEPSNLDNRSKRRPNRRKKSPTPPQDLAPHEEYLWQNRPGRSRTSNNTFSSISLLTHEQYHHQVSTYIDPHLESYAFLHSLHSRSFPQWRFELSEAFNICLYGYGSKKKLVTSFAKYLHSHSVPPPKILIVNGYTPTLTLRQILTTLAILIYDSTVSELPKMGAQPRDMLTTLLARLSSSPPAQPLRVFINSLDAPPLRRAPTPALLALLAGHPSIEFLATCDTPNFPLLWDLNLRNQYNFLFHDTTTMVSYADAEIESVVDNVNALLGRSGRSVKGKEGVGFVLKSLPENAQSLYRILISEILAGLDDRDGSVGDGVAGSDLGGVEYKFLYQKVVEEFICSSEMGFRQLLKEFYDHDMLLSRRDGVGGVEILEVPWRKDECEAILEDLIG